MSNYFHTEGRLRCLESWLREKLGSAQSLPAASTLSGRTGVRVFVRQRRRLETATGSFGWFADRYRRMDMDTVMGWWEKGTVGGGSLWRLSISVYNVEERDLRAAAGYRSTIFLIKGDHERQTKISCQIRLQVVSNTPGGDELALGWIHLTCPCGIMSTFWMGDVLSENGHFATADAGAYSWSRPWL